MIAKQYIFDTPSSVETTTLDMLYPNAVLEGTGEFATFVDNNNIDFPGFINNYNNLDNIFIKIQTSLQRRDLQLQPRQDLQQRRRQQRQRQMRNRLHQVFYNCYVWYQVYKFIEKFKKNFFTNGNGDLIPLRMITLFSATYDQPVPTS